MVVQWINQRIDAVQKDVLWIKERIVLTDAQLAQILEVAQREQGSRELKRSNSYFGVFGLSR